MSIRSFPALALPLLALLPLFGAASNQPAARDLSVYRNFRLGASAAEIVKQAKTEAPLKTIHSRPALIQSLSWRPPYTGWTEKPETVQQIVFHFYQSVLYRIVVSYDQHQTEGLTSADMIQAISRTYGDVAGPTSRPKEAILSYGEPDEVLASWDDLNYRYDLVLAPYGHEYRLIAVKKDLEVLAVAAMAEALRLDVSEAPKREADRALEQETLRKSKIEKARIVNKDRFRP